MKTSPLVDNKIVYAEPHATSLIDVLTGTRDFGVTTFSSALLVFLKVGDALSLIWIFVGTLIASSTLQPS